MELAAENSLALLGVVLLVGLFIPALLERFRIPFVSALILVGAAMGPHGLDYVRPDATLTLFAFLGATFQMLLDGFESSELDVWLFDRNNAIIFGLNGLLPGAVGAGVGFLLGYSWAGIALTAAIFVSSSVPLVFSFVRHFNLDTEELGGRLKAGAVLQDLTGALAAFALLKSVTPHERFPLVILLGLVFSAVIALRMFVPEIVSFAFARFRTQGRAAIEQRVRFVLALMLIVLFLFSALDVPPVVAAFLVGFSLAPIEDASDLRDRLHLIGYSLFVPVFLFIVGLETDIGSMFALGSGGWPVPVLAVAAILSKVLGGYAGGRAIGLERSSAAVLGLGSSVKLTIPITATYAALKAGIIGADLFSAMVVISVTTTLVVPPMLEVALRGRTTPDVD